MAHAQASACERACDTDRASGHVRELRRVMQRGGGRAVTTMVCMFVFTWVGLYCACEWGLG